MVSTYHILCWAALSSSSLRQHHAGHPGTADVNGTNEQSHSPDQAPRPDILKFLYAACIKDLESSRRQMEHWNASVAANRLPNEMLLHIFVLLTEMPSNSEDKEKLIYIEVSEFRRKSLRWTKLMLICRRWRNFAVATPALWRTIDVAKESTNWMKLALVRSADATIDVSLLFKIEEEHISLLLPHCHRLRSLRIQLWSSRALPLLSDTFPALESFEIHCPDYDGYYQLKVLFNVGAECQKSVEDFDLRVSCLVIHLAVKHLQEERKSRGQEGLELRIEGFAERFDKRDERELKRLILPELCDKLEDVGHVDANMLFDDADENCELFKVEYLNTRRSCSRNLCEGRDNLLHFCSICE